MTGGSNIVAVGQEEIRTEAQPAGSGPKDEARAAEVAMEEEWEEETSLPSARLAWLAPTLAIVAILAWTGFFAWTRQSELLAGASPRQWSEWIVAWAVPVVLILGVWLIAMRSSSREAKRFGNIAALLSQESAQLETRLVTVNRELSLAREFIAAQARDLESLGRVASERLSENAEKISGLIDANGTQIDAIARVSNTALENMDKLRGELPVIANSARDVTSQIGNAGRTAHSQLEGLVSGFHRLNEFGEASERQVEALRVKINGALAALERQAQRFDEQEANSLAALSERLAKLQEESRLFAQSLDSGETEAVGKWEAAIERMRSTLAEAIDEVSNIDASALEKARARLNTLRQEADLVDKSLAERVDGFMAGIEQRRAAQEEQEVEATAAMEQRMAELDASIARHRQNQLAHAETLARRGEELGARLEDLNAQLAALAERGSNSAAEVGEAAERLAARLSTNQETLGSIGASIDGLTDSSVRLLEIIQAGSEQSREQLPQAIAAALESLNAFESRAEAVGVVIGEAREKGQALSQDVLSARQSGEAALENIEALHRRIADQGDVHAREVESLRASVAALAEESEAVSERAKGDLTGAIEHLRDALREALKELDIAGTQSLGEIAERIGSDSAETIERVIQLRSSEAIGALEQSAAHASGVGREAARQLRDQLAKVDQLAGNLESRVARARERAEERVDNDFARRVALITESLNSNAIDISKALSNDVTDTAWASYLRGDRGIFTRRAVRLLDNSEAREIAEIYDSDADFREHVRRYIHDFESMLRSMLSTRDGNALGVTLLSSDMGKLYVALAQAIERLRD